ncbi:MAG: hypothetical protein SVU32_03455 [Candidatus Nanohaloarchaea archaeon]|nr:hypothetical protein [Candidatus Nanohaloarchaea archaeon]
MKKLLLAALILLMLPVVTARPPEDYSWSTDPSSGGIQDGFCYSGVTADQDIDCAGVSNWCETRDTNQACTTTEDEWLCNGGAWACDNGVRKEPGNVSRCTALHLEAEGCLSVYQGSFTCYSDGEDTWTPNKPSGCSCQQDYQCMQGVCQAGKCIAYVSPNISIADVRRTVSMLIGDRVQISPKITNKLAKPDNITVTFKGRALEERFISIEVTETEQVQCAPELQQCNVSIPAKSSVEFFVNIDAISYGRGSLIIEGVSQTTKLKGSGSVLVSVDPRGQEQESATGVTAPYFIVLLVAGAVFLFWRKRHDRNGS